jgi:hypothetical protein
MIMGDSSKYTKPWFANGLEMPSYLSLNRVWALKIANVRRDENRPVIAIEFEDKNFGTVNVSENEFKMKNYSAGGYYVVSANNAKYVPAIIFNLEYREVGPQQPVDLKFRAFNYERGTYFEVLDIVTSELNGRERRYEMNNGYVTIWNKPSEARLEVMLKGEWYPAQI